MSQQVGRVELWEVEGAVDIKCDKPKAAKRESGKAGQRDSGTQAG